MLSIGILFGAGWLGSTCVDEWQIGVFGVVSGLILIVAGSDKYSLDQLLISKFPSLAHKKWFLYLGSGNSGITNTKHFNRITLSIAGFSLFLTLYTNQIFHGGVWGTLHNLSLKPNIVISDIEYINKILSYFLYTETKI
jgi:hypothetical protein